MARKSENGSNVRYTLKTAAFEVGKSTQYLRKAIREGKLEATLEPVREGSKVERHIITAEALAEWRDGIGQGFRREDGRGRFVMWATPEELEVLKEAGIPFEKQKSYQKKSEAVTADEA